MQVNKKCPCCQYKTLSVNSMYDVCPVCYWQDDPIQNQLSDFEGGANEVSLQQAKENYNQYSAVQKELMQFIRKPKVFEL